MGRGQLIVGIHSHVKRFPPAEAKSPAGLIELVRGHPQIQQNALDPLQTEVLQDLIHIGEILPNDAYVVKARQTLSTEPDSFWISIQTNEAPSASQLVQNRLAVTAGACSAIHIRPFRGMDKVSDDLLHEDRCMGMLQDDPF